MAYYDNEFNIINDFLNCKSSEICIPNTSKNNLELLQKIRDFEGWHYSGGKGDNPPDFYNDKYKLMMEVMRVDDHSYKNKKGKIVNPYRMKENEIYKEISKYLKENNIQYNGNIIVNCKTDLPTKEDHSYDKYFKDFKRVLEKHNSSSKIYRNNHPNYKLIYMIMDESTSYMEKENLQIDSLVPGDNILAKLHIYFMDKRFISILEKSEADYYIWYTPFKHFNSIEKLELPSAIILSHSDFKELKTIEYNSDDMNSTEM